MRNNLIKILIAALKYFLQNSHSCQYSITDVQKSDYLPNKSRETLPFKLIVGAEQRAVIMHKNFGLQLYDSPKPWDSVLTLL